MTSVFAFGKEQLLFLHRTLVRCKDFIPRIKKDSTVLSESFFHSRPGVELKSGARISLGLTKKHPGKIAGVLTIFIPCLGLQSGGNLLIKLEAVVFNNCGAFQGLNTAEYRYTVTLHQRLFDGFCIHHTCTGAVAFHFYCKNTC